MIPSTIQVTVRFCSVPPQFRRTPWGWSGTSHLSSLSTKYTRGLAARWLFRVPPCRKGTIHLQTSMSSPGFERSPYGITVSVSNYYTGWTTPKHLPYASRDTLAPTMRNCTRNTCHKPYGMKGVDFFCIMKAGAIPTNLGVPDQQQANYATRT
ncbi:hypothetical protein TNCV_1006181 [Trichonephila clavipes]|nr:hypothetical protein TNCV_1006181 [Trichonephila clavipes]